MVAILFRHCNARARYAPYISWICGIFFKSRFNVCITIIIIMTWYCLRSKSHTETWLKSMKKYSKAVTMNPSQAVQKQTWTDDPYPHISGWTWPFYPKYEKKIDYTIKCDIKYGLKFVFDNPPRSPPPPPQADAWMDVPFQPIRATQTNWAVTGSPCCAQPGKEVINIIALIFLWLIAGRRLWKEKCQQFQI